MKAITLILFIFWMSVCLASHEVKIQLRTFLSICTKNSTLEDRFLESIFDCAGIVYPEPLWPDKFNVKCPSFKKIMKYQKKKLIPAQKCFAQRMGWEYPNFEAGPNPTWISDIGSLWNESSISFTPYRFYRLYGNGGEIDSPSELIYYPSQCGSNLLNAWMYERCQFTARYTEEQMREMRESYYEIAKFRCGVQFILKNCESFMSFLAYSFEIFLLGIPDAQPLPGWFDQNSPHYNKLVEWILSKVSGLINTV